MSTSMSICAYWTSACTPLSVLPVATKFTLLSLLTFVAASSMQDCIVLLFGCFRRYYNALYCVLLYCWLVLYYCFYWFWFFCYCIRLNKSMNLLTALKFILPSKSCSTLLLHPLGKYLTRSIFWQQLPAAHRVPTFTKNAQICCNFFGQISFRSGIN